MKKVLWISRHPLSEEAVKAISNYFGDKVTIETQNIVFSNIGENAYVELAKVTQKENYAAIGGVFPAQLWAHLIKVAKASATSNENILTNLFVVVSTPAKAEDGVTRNFKFDHIEWVTI